jgi:hypothetical protein
MGEMGKRGTVNSSVRRCMVRWIKYLVPVAYVEALISGALLKLEPNRDFGIGMFSAAVLWLGLATGCLAALAPVIVPAGVHRSVEKHDSQAECLVCHRLESTARARPEEVIIAPLVMDWMIEPTLGSCLECHTLDSIPGRK